MGVTTLSTANRFSPPSLETDQLREAQNALLQRKVRRESFRLGTGLIRLLVDGNEHLSFDPSGEEQTVFRLPRNAGFIELHGHDDQGDILLAAFMIPESWMTLERFVDQVALRHRSGSLIKIKISSLPPKRQTSEPPLLQVTCLPGRRNSLSDSHAVKDRKVGRPKSHARAPKSNAIATS
jgi:hypothetical protein